MSNEQRQGTQRTLQILTALGHHPDSTVTAIRSLTGISRPAIYRLLAILIDLGYAIRRTDGDTYSLTSRIRTLTYNFRDEDRVIELARPVLLRLQERITWPTDFVSYEDGAMVCRESTRRKSPLVLERDDVGSRIPVLRSAVGLVYLAFSAPETRELVLRVLRRSQSPNDALAHDTVTVAKLVADTQRRGYGTRDCTYRPRTCSIAVPVVDDGRVFGCIGTEFMRSAFTPEEAAQKYVAELKGAAEALLRALKAEENANASAAVAAAALPREPARRRSNVQAG